MNRVGSAGVGWGGQGGGWVGLEHTDVVLGRGASMQGCGWAGSSGYRILEEVMFMPRLEGAGQRATLISGEELQAGATQEQRGVEGRVSPGPPGLREGQASHLLLVHPKASLGLCPSAVDVQVIRQVNPRSFHLAGAGGGGG